ncbi:MAG: hypothetical protein HKM02_07985 [Pseudomonadales bacterium]|nr:hypothetical protein [Pseudomonadales bacterium]
MKWMIYSLVLLLMTKAVLADPQNGFSFAIGSAYHDAHVSINGVPQQHYKGPGLGIGGDAQFVVNEHWSVNPFLQAAAEYATGDLRTHLFNSQGGLEIRRWWGNVYVSPMLDESAEQLYKGATITRATFGPGVGLATGWESSHGWLVRLQADAPEILYFSANQRRAGAWLLVGYRWR